MEYLFLSPIAVCLIIEGSKNLRFFFYPKVYKENGFEKLIKYEKHSKKINILYFSEKKQKR